jgi:hypothetical protein
MNTLAELQFENNAASRDCWGLFRAHRDKATGLLSNATRAGRLCVLGAGNANDLDLNVLLGFYREIHLTDLDAEALSLGVARQGLEGCPAIYLQGGIDLTEMMDVMASWSPSSPVSDDDLTACAEHPLRRVRPAMPGPFDVVVSCCLLSQIINCVVRTAGEQHPRFLAAIQAVRVGHLRLLVDLVAPGGVGLLITDLVSSDTCPPLASIADAELPALASRLLQQRNFFHGVNPAAYGQKTRTQANRMRNVCLRVA